MRRLALLFLLVACAPAQAQGTGGASSAIATDDSVDLPTTHPDGARWLAGRSETPNRTDPDPNRTFHLGWNTGPHGMPVEASEPSWRLTWEAGYEAQDGGPFYDEWHLQWTSAQGHNIRPVSVSVNRTDETIVGALFRGRFTVWANNTPSQALDVVQATGRVNVTLGTPGGQAATLVSAHNGAPALEQYGTNRVVEIARVDTANVLHFGSRASGVRFDAPRPTVTTCAELGEALDAMGLVDWQPAP